MTKPKPCTIACAAVIIPRFSGTRFVKSAKYARSPLSQAARPTPRNNLVGIRNSIVFASAVPISATAIIPSPASITGFLPYLSAICPVGTNINIAKAGALMTNPFALCDKPIDCAYNGNAGNKTPTPMYKTNCESNKPASGVKTVSPCGCHTRLKFLLRVPDDDDDDDDDVVIISSFSLVLSSLSFKSAVTI